MTTVARWITRRSVATFLAAMVMLAAGAAINEAAAQASTVRLVVDYGDGTMRIFTALPWSNGMTVRDALVAAKAHPRGIDFKERGSGATAFVTEIDNVASDGGRSGKKNWQFWVNTSYADRSFGVYQLQALDVVTWRLATDQGK